MCIAKIINILYLSIKLRNIAKYFIVWCKFFNLHHGLTDFVIWHRLRLLYGYQENG